MIFYKDTELGLMELFLGSATGILFSFLSLFFSLLKANDNSYDLGVGEVQLK